LASIPDSIQEDPADLCASLPKPIKHRPDKDNKKNKVDDIAQDLKLTD